MGCVRLGSNVPSARAAPRPPPALGQRGPSFLTTCRRTALRWPRPSAAADSPVAPVPPPARPVTAGGRRTKGQWWPSRVQGSSRLPQACPSRAPVPRCHRHRLQSACSGSFPFCKFSGKHGGCASPGPVVPAAGSRSCCRAWGGSVPGAGPGPLPPVPRVSRGRRQSQGDLGLGHGWHVPPSAAASSHVLLPHQTMLGARDAPR